MCEKGDESILLWSLVNMTKDESILLWLLISMIILTFSLCCYVSALQMKKLIKDLYIRENCHPAKSSLVLWFQIPMWVCLSFALRNMSGAVPIASGDIGNTGVCVW